MKHIHDAFSETILSRLWESRYAGGVLQIDARAVEPGDIFIAVAGSVRDGRSYIKDALENGAALVLADATECPEFSEQLVDAHNVLWVKELKLCLGRLADELSDHPSARLNVYAVTGTNGKTTVSHLLSRVLSFLGSPSAVIGTLGYGEPDRLMPLVNTTPDVITVHRILSELADSGIRNVAMEASSHGLDQGRLDHVNVTCAIVTNLTRDHLDYHGDMETYARAKEKLISREGLNTIVLNADDPRVLQMRSVATHGARIITFSMSDRADVDVALLSAQYECRGVDALIRVGAEVVSLHSRLLGTFNLANVLAVVSALWSQGYDPCDISEAMEKVGPVLGRMDVVALDSDKSLPAVVVDYAHTPDALVKALQAMRLHAGGALWCVFGCGGDRDRGKRPLMGAAVAEYADHIVVTADNPRSESLDSIIADILSGIKTGKDVMVIPARDDAIGFAVGKASEGDMILIAGKGHEQYQDFATQRTYFSDHKSAESALALRKGRALADWSAT